MRSQKQYGLDQDSKEALSEAASRSAKTIKLELENMPGSKREIAILFAREFGSMDDETVAQIREMLKQRTKEE